MIYKIRGVQVILSSDVAKLYNVETKRLNEVIKRNINRFPETFCFQLTDKEIDELSLRLQFMTSNNKNSINILHSSSKI
jgi:hypothetical protein